MILQPSDSLEFRCEEVAVGQMRPANASTHCYLSRTLVAHIAPVFPLALFEGFPSDWQLSISLVGDEC